MPVCACVCNKNLSFINIKGNKYIFIQVFGFTYTLMYWIYNWFYEIVIFDIQRSLQENENINTKRSALFALLCFGAGN